MPGANNSTVPGGIDTYMNDPDYIFAVATQYLDVTHVPQGDFYNFLAKYGAGQELQKLEQLYATLGYGTYPRVGYILTGPWGGRKPSQLQAMRLPPTPAPRTRSDLDDVAGVDAERRAALRDLEHHAWK